MVKNKEKATGRKNNEAKGGEKGERDGNRQSYERPGGKGIRLNPPLYRGWVVWGIGD